MKIFLVVLVLIITSCAFNKTETYKRIPPSEEVVARFKIANSTLDKKNYLKAIELYDDVLLQSPSSELESVVIFNKGIAYEGLKDCLSAEQSFSKVVHLLAKKRNKLYALALYKNSYAQTCLGKDDKAIVSLLTAKQFSHLLGPEVAYAEIPAKLAAAYARDGNRKEAFKYFKIAELGIRNIHSKFKNPHKKRELLAKTLFLMGNMEQVDPMKISSKSYLDTVRHLQGYLLQSVELNSKQWSRKAAKQLKSAYANTWVLVRNTPYKRDLKSKALIVRERKKNQRTIVRKSLLNLTELRKKSFPGTTQTKVIRDLNSHLNLSEKKMQTFLAKNVLKSSQTKESQNRNSLKRKIKMVDPKRGK